MKLTPEEKRKVVSCCNGNLIPDHDFDWVHNYPREWFQQKFDFIPDERLKEHLGDEFYQTRFAYTLMQTLSLPMSKNKGIIKFQIIRYASICEALLNYTLEHYFKETFENQFAAVTFKKCSQALTEKTKITYDGKALYLCDTKSEKAKIEWTANPVKADFALENGILSETTKKKYCELYDLRNNAHILKAARADYYPRLKDASAAYELAVQFIEEIRAYFNAHTLDS